MNQDFFNAQRWLGLCPKAPVARASQAAVVNLPESAREGRPAGGAGGSGTIRRGIGSALSGMRTLNRNRYLLWFTLLAGLVLAGNAIGNAALRYLNRTMQTSMIEWLVLNFLIEFATLFCLVFLLAGLVLSISSKKEGSASFFMELAGAKKYLKAIFVWSLVLAVAGMLLDSIFFYFPVLFPREFGFLYGLGQLNSFLFSTLSHFPFNLTPYPPMDIFTEVPGYGGRSLLLWIYPGFMETLIFSAINLLLFILTLFVVPFIVLEQKTIREAVAGSFAMMKKTWVEVAACAVFLGVVISGVFLTYLLVQAAHGMFTPPGLAFIYRPTDTWIALGLLYDLALFSVAFVVATVGGIAALDLYTAAKSRQITGSPEQEPHA
jgi:hypothetical protein